MISTAALGELVTLSGPDGSTATVALHGAHIVSWKTADGAERLFLSSLATIGGATTIDGATAIRGGIPVCFPQFAGLGPLPKHGFARIATWEHRGGGVFALIVAPGAWPGWPHECELLLNVGLGPSTLSVSLTVCNRGSTAFDFTGALHSYLSCDDVTRVRISGLDGRTVQRGGEVDGDITFADGQTDVDLSVLCAAGPVTVICGSDSPLMLCAQTGFADVVVWNIGETLGAGMKDLGVGEWKSYVCVEAAAVGTPITVEPGTSWNGSQVLVAGVWGSCATKSIE